MDHEPLVAAGLRGPVLPLFIIEPDILRAPDSDALHFRFIYQSLLELRESLHELGQPLVVRSGVAVTVLETLRKEIGFDAIWSHEETGNRLTYQRDLDVKQWVEFQRISWYEIPQNGVVRRLKSRDGWAKIWEHRIARSAPIAKPNRLQNLPNLEVGAIQTADELGLRNSATRQASEIQRGGESEAHQYLSSFLVGRGKNYRRAMSGPTSGAVSCSRVSPYLAWGCLSVRQAAYAAQNELVRTDRQIPKTAIRSFLGRLHWHCHFIQKLESEPDIEFHSFNRACYLLRSNPSRDHGHFFEAWITGHTGYPFVDACMRSLRATGWLNFRMRAMLVSFAAYNLWLDWRVLIAPLARQFLDYEPGIHLSQIQMQSGTTGINTLWIYNPVKQGLDHDPDGSFIRRWVPEIANIFTPLIHTPWELGANHRSGYPAPIVNHLVTAREAKLKFSTLRKSALHKEEARRVFIAHGSRKRGRGDREIARRINGNDLPADRFFQVESKSPASQLEIDFR